MVAFVIIIVMHKNALIFLLTITSLSFSCKKQELPPLDFSLDIEVFNAEDFPISLNNYWEYRWWDTRFGRHDTLRGTVVAHSVSKGAKDDLWAIEWSKRIRGTVDTQYIEFSDTPLTEVLQELSIRRTS